MKIAIPFAQAPLAAKLPPGWTLGNANDPATYGASFYRGTRNHGKIADSSSSTGFYWDLEGKALIEWTGELEDLLLDAANQAYRGWGPGTGAWFYGGLESATPEMYAILSDPEWIARAGTPVVWAELSAELQAKIEQVPLLVQQLKP